jgi:hypothetical protein
MVVISFICFFLSIYFVMISLYMVFDELLTRQLLAVATSFLAGGTITAMSLTVAKILEKIYSRKRKTKPSTHSSETAHLHLLNIRKHDSNHGNTAPTRHSPLTSPLFPSTTRLL